MVAEIALEACNFTTVGGPIPQAQDVTIYHLLCTRSIVQNGAAHCRPGPGPDQEVRG